MSLTLIGVGILSILVPFLSISQVVGCVLGEEREDVAPFRCEGVVQGRGYAHLDHWPVRSTALLTGLVGVMKRLGGLAVQVDGARVVGAGLLGRSRGAGFEIR